MSAGGLSFRGHRRRVVLVTAWVCIFEVFNGRCVYAGRTILVYYIELEISQSHPRERITPAKLRSLSWERSHLCVHRKIRVRRARLDARPSMCVMVSHWFLFFLTHFYRDACCQTISWQFHSKIPNSLQEPTNARCLEAQTHWSRVILYHSHWIPDFLGVGDEARNE